MPTAQERRDAAFRDTERSLQLVPGQSSAGRRWRPKKCPRLDKVSFGRKVPENTFSACDEKGTCAEVEGKRPQSVAQNDKTGVAFRSCVHTFMTLIRKPAAGDKGVEAGLEAPHARVNKQGRER